MPHYYLFKLKKNNVVFEFSSQDSKVMYSQFNKWAEELINSVTKEQPKAQKRKSEPALSKSSVKQVKMQPKVKEPIVIEKAKNITNDDYEAMQSSIQDVENEAIKDYPRDFKENKKETEQQKPPVKLTSLSLDDIDVSTRDNKESFEKEDEHVEIIYYKKDKSVVESKAEEDELRQRAKVNIDKIISNVNPKTEIKTAVFNKIENEVNSNTFNNIEKEPYEKEDEIYTKKIEEDEILREKFKPANSSIDTEPKDQFFKILQKKFSSITEDKEEKTESVQQPVNEALHVEKAETVETILPKATNNEFAYTYTSEAKNIEPNLYADRMLDLKNLNNLIQLKKPDNMFDYLLIAAYYLKEGEYLDRYSLKQINSKIFAYTRKPIDHSIIQKAVAKNYIEVVPDYTGMAEVTEYVITDEGENYIINEL